MKFLSTSMMVSLLVVVFMFVLSLQEAQEVVDKDTISSNDEENGRRTRSVLNSGDCDSGEVSNGDEEECSCGECESDLVHTDSRVVRQLQPEEETSFGVLVGVLFLVLCLVDFLGGEIVFGVFEGEILRSLVK